MADASWTTGVGTPDGPPASAGPDHRGTVRGASARGRAFGCPPTVGDPISDDDAQLALYCCYELHYRGFADVPDEAEWAPRVIEFRSSLERAFESALRDAPGSPDAVAGGDVTESLWKMAAAATGPSLSRWVLEHGTLAHARELAVHRSAYQLKEADPHTWAIPRLEGRSKAALVALQADEYGNGVAAKMHSSLFGDTMIALGLDATYGAYLDALPGTTLATTNLISMLGLHRRLRGALVGHLALFEMTSVVPMGRYSSWLARLGIGPSGRRFYDVHVEADAVHQLIAATDLAGGLVEAAPELADEVRFGARALTVVESRFTEALLGAWAAGSSALFGSSPLGAVPPTVGAP